MKDHARLPHPGLPSQGPWNPVHKAGGSVLHVPHISEDTGPHVNVGSNLACVTVESQATPSPTTWTDSVTPPLLFSHSPCPRAHPPAHPGVHAGGMMGHGTPPPP